MAALGADVVFTDMLEGRILPTLKHNIAANLSADREYKCRRVVWGNTGHIRKLRQTHWDIVFGGDVVYKPHLVMPLLKTAYYLCTSASATSCLQKTWLFLSFEEHDEHSVPLLWNRIGELFDFEVIDRSQQHAEYSDPEHIFIVKATAKELSDEQLERIFTKQSDAVEE